MDNSVRDIFVISDLHLGDGGSRDNFEAERKTPQMRAFLDYVGGEGGELFILGDMFELWQMNLSSLFIKRSALLDHFASLPMFYVPGNHDIDLAYFMGSGFLAHPFFLRMQAPFTRTIGGRQFRFAHGHETDPFNSGRDPGFGRMLSIFAGIFEDRNGSPLLEKGDHVEAVLEQFGDSMLMLWTCAMAAIESQGSAQDMSPRDALTPVQNPHRLIEHVTQVRADLESNRYDAVVLGHTHKLGRIGDWYFNSGSWVGPSNPFLRISPDGHVRRLEWKDGHALEHEMPVLLGAPPAEARRGRRHRPLAEAITTLRTFFPKPQKPDRSRVVLFLQGLLAVSVGIGALLVAAGQGSAAGLRLLVSIFGAYALFDGTLSLFGAVREPPVRRLLYRVRGVASILLGLVVLHRSYTVEIFVLLIGVWAFVAGALRVAAAVVFRRMVESTWLLVIGASSMVGGLALLFLPPSAALLKIAVSGYLCVYGGSEILAAVFGPNRLSSQGAARRSR